MRVDKQADPVARTIHKRGQMKKAHNISLKKSPGIIKLETRLETSMAISLSLDPRVMTFRPQPMTIEMGTGRVFATKAHLHRSFEGLEYKSRPYTPDFEVTLETGIVFIETKHSRLIERSPDALEYPSILKNYGLRLVLVDETFFPEVFCQNIRLLHPYQSCQFSSAEQRMVASAAGMAATIGELTTNQQIPQNLILAAIAQGVLHAELHESRLGVKTLISAQENRHISLERLPL
ncbi:hypothetical protein [Halocynthiibacter styelae]|uniref:TnsA endonuclease N-terminal domain-containing protein n=1 Tax=Halocynthiibacter styelae TaxID=2761955 RepID=A0A8J7IEU6_9RHOB|nr:hypothetical protein [Paenihalocynthiibacter styelae]MBI1495269.1 hypothetical protein [Paenihalocynthiibacter styelae]